MRGPFRALVAGLCGLAVVACTREPPAPPVPSPAGESFVVASGADGVALVGDGWIERVLDPGADGGSDAGPRAVALPGERAAVVSAGRIAVVRAHAPAVVADCADCSGVAWTGQQVVTTRRSLRADNSFDILAFDAGLQPVPPVRATRRAERAATDYPQENVESPTTLAADAGSVTVIYLARDGGVRRGPSVLARYDRAGQLLDSVRVGGVVRDALVSPDGAYLALGAGGSGGACVTSSDLVVVTLDGLEPLDLGPPLPAGFAGEEDSAWTYATDLQWRGGKVVATSRVYAPGPFTPCDPRPQLWTRTADPVTLDVIDARDVTADASRRVGPGCDGLVTVVAHSDDDGWQTRYELRSGAGVLGNYRSLALSPCP